MVRHFVIHKASFGPAAHVCGSKCQVCITRGADMHLGDALSFVAAAVRDGGPDRDRRRVGGHAPVRHQLRTVLYMPLDA